MSAETFFDMADYHGTITTIPRPKDRYMINELMDGPLPIPTIFVMGHDLAQKSANAAYYLINFVLAPHHRDKLPIPRSLMEDVK